MKKWQLFTIFRVINFRIFQFSVEKKKVFQFFSAKNVDYDRSPFFFRFSGAVSAHERQETRETRATVVIFVFGTFRSTD